MNPRFAYIPIEIKAREFESRLLLSAKLAELGIACIFGTKTGVGRSMDIFPKGVYLDKSISSNKVSRLKYYKSRSQFLACIDEETGIARTDISTFYDMRMSQDTLNLTDLFFCYGNDDYDYLCNKYADDKQKFRLTGSPRVDLWNPAIVSRLYKKRIEEIRNSYGEYILVNSSFGITSVEAVENRVAQYLKYGYIDSDEVDKTRKEINTRYEQFLLFARMVEEVCRMFPEETVVLRPHPAERIEDWHHVLGKFDNLKVVREGIATPWIYNCKCLIHEGCTTAVEAAILGKEIISFIYKDYYTLNDLPNRIGGRITQTYEELKREIEEIIGEGSQFRQTKIDRDMVDNRIYIDKNELAAEKIARELNLLPFTGIPVNVSSAARKSRRRYFLSRLRAIFSFSNFRSYLSSRGNENRDSYFHLIENTFYNTAKIPGGIQKDEIRSFLDALENNGLVSCPLHLQQVEVGTYLINSGNFQPGSTKDGSR